MIRSNRRGWSALLVRVFVLLVALAVWPTTRAIEPDGHLRLQLERLSPSDGSLVVRLKIRPFVALDEATLLVAAPLAFDLRSRTPEMHTEFEQAHTRAGLPAVRADLHGLDPALHSVVEFELTLPPGKYGTLEFIVEGRDGNGRHVRGAVGLLAPDPASAGVRRLGAVEFPAVALPDAGKR